jgi:hypothetical protein
MAPKLDVTLSQERGLWKVDVLSESNWHTWKTDAKFAMIGLDLYDAIEDEKVSTKIDRKALAWIVMSVAPHLRSLVKDCNTALEAWKILETTFETNGLAGLMDIMQQLLRLHLENDGYKQENMTSYYARTRRIGDLFEAAGEEISETLLCLAALNGLPRVYSTHAVMLTTGSDTEKVTGSDTKKKVKGLELSKVFAILRQAEQTIKDAEEEEGVAFAATTAMDSERAAALRQGTCFNCGERGHRSFECTKPKKGPKSSCIKEESVAMNAFVDEDEEGNPGWDVSTSMGPQTAQAWANIQDRR